MSSPPEPSTCGCDKRTVCDIVTLCASTLLICAWNAVHVDVPPRKTFRHVQLTRVYWLLIALFLPEMLLCVALGQLREARMIIREGSQTWTLSHGFFVAMGALSATVPDRRSGREHRTLTTGNFLDLIRSNPNNVPNISADEIADRSKAGTVSKALLCLQIVFFCASCAARLNQHVPLTLLEITTFAHCLCALVAYAAWWYKPLDVIVPIPIALHNNADDGSGSIEYDAGLQRFFYSYSSVPAFYKSKPGRSLNWVRQLGLGQLVLASILIPTLYGLPHLLGFWQEFSTLVEHRLWRASTILVIGLPSVWPVAFFLLTTRTSWGERLATLLIPHVMLAYLLANGFLVCESVRQLFSLPPGAFVDVPLSHYVPHISIR
ncbi:hypothetical protein EXIGLDRAFT_796580 [Exidia glandulosa HHB12029]|uniref:Uncharacterized protein n=1 Tax=Exidia glandulosa HHB12029 TaxID=1314781 RepID=A0A165FKU1_EXIGL|nr:hypothetical protein EXIGLDRAFT_796580 [Exidia glandulosa HHB12029]